jgi:hypothetical protein
VHWNIVIDKRLMFTDRDESKGGVAEDAIPFIDYKL